VTQDERVAVTTTSATYTADRVVVALPPVALGRVGFDPVLPIDRRGWVSHLAMGRVAKVHAVYDRPFWRERGLSGIASIYDEGPLGVVFDNSPADASAGVLVGFVYGDRVSAWSALDDDARRDAVLASLERVVGPDALAADDYTEKIWPHDPWVHGGYEAYATPGAWTGYGRDGWRTPHGRVHWAGTETASRWNGYIDGALESGYRAAAEVLAAEEG
jgi:monoamine oxidase